MYNPSYVTSTLSVRYRAPISYSFNDYSCDYRYNSHLISSSQSCCCICCSSYVYRSPSNPSFVCGSRQSSLIHVSASRRFLIQPGPDQCCFRALVQDPCRKCYCGCVKERGFGGEMGRDLGERRFKRMASEGRSCDFETTEMMLSLLIEDVAEECCDVSGRDYSLSRRLGFERKCRESEKKKKNVELGLSGSGSRSKHDGVRIDSRENEARNRRKEDRNSDEGDVFRRANRRGGKSGSSCSSYLTYLSLGEESESDSEVHVRNEAYGEESSEGYKRDSKESRNVVYKGEIKENLRRHEGVVGSHKMIESDWRKKTEKKLDEVAIEDVCEASHHQGSSSHRGIDIFDDNKSKKFIHDSGTAHQYSRKSDQKDHYRFSADKSNQVSKIEDVNVKRTNVSQSEYEDRVKRKENQFSGISSLVQNTEKRGYLESEKNSKQMDLRRKFQQSAEISDDRLGRRDDYGSSTEQSNQVSQVEDINMNRTNFSQSQYEDKVKRQEDYYLKTENDSRQIDMRRKFQQSAQISDDRVNRRVDNTSNTGQSKQVSQIQDTKVKRTNISQARYRDQAKRREDQSSVISSSVQDTEKRYNIKSEEDLRQMDSRRNFRQSAEISDDRVSQRDDYRINTQQSKQVSQIQDINASRTNISHTQYEDEVKRREDRSVLISSSGHDTEYQYYLQSEGDSRQMDSRRKLQQSTEISDGRVSRRDDYRSSTEQSNQDSQIQDKNVRTDISLEQYDNKVKRQEDRSSVISSSVQDTENQYYFQSEEDLRHMDSRRKLQRSSEISATQAQDTQSGRQSNRKKESQKGSLEMSTIVRGQSSDTQVANVATSENRISSQKAFQLTEESKSKNETSYNRILRIGSIKDTGGSSRKASTSQASLVLETIPNVGDKSNSQGIMETTPVADQTQSYDDPLSSVSHEYAFESAHRFQKSSSEVVGEFLEKATLEASTSKSQIEKSTFEEDRILEGHKHEQKSSSEYGKADFKLKDKESRRSSGSLGVKGPDEIWDEVAPSIQESIDTQRKVPEKTSPSGNIIVKRTGRSLWNVFSDIVRLRWSAHPKISTPKSSIRNSPNQSASEAWFSGRERDETSEENIKNGNKIMSHESIPTPTGSQGEGYSSSSSKDKISPNETLIVSTTPKGSSSVSTEENPKLSGSKLMETSVSMPSLRIRRSPNVDDAAESDQMTTVTVHSPINVEGSEGKAGGDMKRKMLQRTNQVIKDKFDGVAESDKRTTVSETEGKVGGDMKRRMLQRTNQVIKDRFDEWEVAFTLETEQRKIDEEFMREALLEARKAGDMWEVPVGAVVVQHGKIIARGYNLVEELRDSTAHAEMICIREASNQLRSWRLSDTTLYVTLEPCPMCAGAILQARVDTVVWGAPNKLLGADGSWIRLFPDGGEGGTSSDPTAPVHPFHPKIAIRRGVLGTECADVMQQFFQLRRRKKDKQLPETSPTPPSCLPISNHPTKILTKMHDAFHFMFCL